MDEQETKAIKDRWVINKSGRTLNQHQLSIIQRGLNFAVYPTALLNAADYKTKCQDLLNDKRTYKQLRKDQTNIYRTKLINLLKEHWYSGAITQEHTCQPREKFSRDKRRPVERSEAGFGRGVRGSSP